VGDVAYKLKLPDHAKIHPIFHVSQLKPFKGYHTIDHYLPLPLTMTDSSNESVTSQNNQERTTKNSTDPNLMG
jgi:hypothetical protein